MKNPKSLKKHIYELLETSEKALSVGEIILALEKTCLVKKTKQQIRNALNAYGAKEIVRIGKETYDLLTGIVNGAYYRYTLGEQEIRNGILPCDYELHFIFDPYGEEDKRQLKFFQKAKLINEANIKFCGPLVLPRRRIEGFNEWIRKENFVSNDDLIIKIIDIAKGLYELIPQKKAARDELLIQEKNKEIADLVERILNRIGGKGCWPDELIKRVMATYSYKDSCPPDHLTKIVKKDKRFVIHRIEIPYAEVPAMIEIHLADARVGQNFPYFLG